MNTLNNIGISIDYASIKATKMFGYFPIMLNCWVFGVATLVPFFVFLVDQRKLGDAFETSNLV